MDDRVLIRRDGLSPEVSEILSHDALQFIVQLHRRFDRGRRAVLQTRKSRQEDLDSGGLPDFLEETENIRGGSWQVAEAPADLEDRRVEITGPADRKMMINALNSGASVFMADLEDSLSPTCTKLLDETSV